MQEIALISLTCLVGTILFFSLGAIILPLQGHGGDPERKVKRLSLVIAIMLITFGLLAQKVLLMK